jgi:hypothetical protein
MTRDLRERSIFAGVRSEFVERKPDGSPRRPPSGVEGTRFYRTSEGQATPQGCASTSTNRGHLRAAGRMIDTLHKFSADALFDELSRREAEHNGEDLVRWPFLDRKSGAEPLRDTEAGILLNEHVAGPDGVRARLRGLAPRALFPREWPVPVDRVRARSGSWSAIPPVSPCSGSGARNGSCREAGLKKAVSNAGRFDDIGVLCRIAAGTAGSGKLDGRLSRTSPNRRRGR